MIKKLSSVDNSRELLGITKDAPLEIATDREALTAHPAKLSAKDRIRESTKRMMAVHDETLRKLAK
jgi:hypothetical protein